MKNELIQKFTEVFGSGAEVQVFFAPGRVNLIGEHTDYNGGHVFPCALTIGTYGVVRKRDDEKLRFYSMNFENKGIIENSIHDLVYKTQDSWANYPKGVIQTMQQKGYEIDKGMDILFYGNIPNGSGLSSSASLEVLTAYVLKQLFTLELSLVEIALLCQYAENNFIGVNCGIMDQFAVAMGKKNHAIFLDTANLTYEYAPLNLDGVKIVIMNTNKKRELGDSKYNERRRECDEALAELQKVLPINTLGDLTIGQFEEYKDAISHPVKLKRARHAVYENQRTIMAIEALKKNDLIQFGRLMIQSHESLREDYEVTGIELDTIVETALKQKGVLGARMTGAGFGGCAISIVKEEEVENFITGVAKEYQDRIGYEASFYVVEIGGGPTIL